MPPAPRLIFLHGPPACGKFTVGRALAARTGFALYHNHEVVDEVLKQHAFGTPGFIALRDRRWRDYLGRHPAPTEPAVIFTFSPENTVPPAFLDWLFTAVPARGVRLDSIELAASEAAIESRLGSAPRRQFQKLVDLPLYRELRAAGNFSSPVIPRVDLRVDTERNSPEAAAQIIAAHLGP